MDEMTRTCSVPFEMPDEVLMLLSRAADYGSELTYDFGDWDEDVRAQVLNAARTVDVFHLGRPSAFRVELADNALRRSAHPLVASSSTIG